MNANAPAFVPSIPNTGGSSLMQQPRRRGAHSVPTRVEKPLRWEDGPLVWIDCEMTGLDFKNDRILEIAVIITNGNLDIVDPEGLSYIIKTDKDILDAMHPWCVKQHGESGLTDACLNSPYDAEFVKQQVLAYIKSWIPNDRAALLAGNSVHADKAFLAEWMPELVEHLHYRIVDVSTVKELCRRWYPEVSDHRTNSVAPESKHRALDDILGSIEELKYYRETIFKGRDDILRGI